MLRVLYKKNNKKGQNVSTSSIHGNQSSNTIAKLEKGLIYGIKCPSSTNVQTLVNTAYKASNLKSCTHASLVLHLILVFMAT